MFDCGVLAGGGGLVGGGELGRGRTFGGEGALAFGCVEVEIEGVGGRGGGEVEEDIMVGVGGVVAGDAEEGHCCVWRGDALRGILGVGGLAGRVAVLSSDGP